MITLKIIIEEQTKGCAFGVQRTPESSTTTMEMALSDVLVRLISNDLTKKAGAHVVGDDDGTKFKNIFGGQQ